MQVEDDTFVAWRRIKALLDKDAFTSSSPGAWYESVKVEQLRPRVGEVPAKINEYSYIGLPVSNGTVDRNLDSSMYESPDRYGSDVYPLYMARFGFILGR